MDSVKIYNFRGRLIGRIDCDDCIDIRRFASECNIRTLFLTPVCVGVDLYGKNIYSDKFDKLQMSNKALKDFYFMNNFANEHFNVIIYL